jgi:crotonobetainyl-CoA:carnitine CoA-transferase CaiB-like acyl-CoA transferase
LGLLRAIERDDLADDARFATRRSRIQHRERIQELLDATFAGDSREVWLSKLRAEDVPCAPINDLGDVVADPQVQHIGLVREVVHPEMGSLRLLGSGVNLHGTPTQTGAAPVAGQHTEEVLAEVGMSPEAAGGPADSTGDRAASPSVVTVDGSKG